MVTSCQGQKRVSRQAICRSKSVRLRVRALHGVRLDSPCRRMTRRKTAWLQQSHSDIVGDKRISQHLSRFSAFARHSHRDARDRGQLCHCFAADRKGTMPFAPAQTRPNDLTSTLGAMDAITTVEGHRELAVPPRFVNIVGDGRRHGLPPQAATCGITGLDAIDALSDCWCEE
jgi:hypothetical protein